MMLPDTTIAELIDTARQMLLREHYCSHTATAKQLGHCPGEKLRTILDSEQVRNFRTMKQLADEVERLSYEYREKRKELEAAQNKLHEAALYQREGAQHEQTGEAS